MSFLGDLLGSFTGQTQAGHIRRGTQQANALLTSNRDTAAGQINSGFDRAFGYINPFIQSGSRYQGMYDDLLGMNGADARTRAQGIITSDPLWQGQLGQAQNAALRMANARGMGGSGAALLAGQRVLNEQYGNVLNRYQGGAQQGAQAAGIGANLAATQGSQLGNLTYGTGQQLAGNQINQANALATAAGILPQNIMNVASMLIGGFRPGMNGQTAFGNMGAALGNMGNSLWGAGANNSSQFTPAAQPPPNYYTNPLFSTVPYGGM